MLFKYFILNTANFTTHSGEDETVFKNVNQVTNNKLSLYSWK